MLIFNEGAPRSGKSYDAVVTHILAAMKAKRRVFVRLNGFEPDQVERKQARCEYLGITVEEHDSVITHLDDDAVRRLHEIATPNSLVVVDECHAYWVAGKEPLPAVVEQFWAMHGHKNIDVVLISQYFKRLHSAVRARIERKSVFTKQTAVGLQGKYIVRYYQAITPDKFEKVDAKTRSYDPAIFPLYRGYSDDANAGEVYTAGARTVWHKVAIPALLVVPVAIFGAWFLLSFFTGGVDIIDTPKPAHAPVKDVAGPSARVGAPTPTVVPSFSQKPTMPPGPAYVWKLSEKSRPRVSGKFEGQKRTTIIIEWRDEQGHVAERLTNFALRELGVRVEETSFGARLSYGGESVVATAYPVNEEYGRISQNRLESMRPTRGFGAPASLASSRTASARTSSSASTVPRIGQHYKPPGTP